MRFKASSILFRIKHAIPICLACPLPVTSVILISHFINLKNRFFHILTYLKLGCIFQLIENCKHFWASGGCDVHVITHTYANLIVIPGGMTG